MLLLLLLSQTLTFSYFLVSGATAAQAAITLLDEDDAVFIVVIKIAKSRRLGYCLCKLFSS